MNFESALREAMFKHGLPYYGALDCKPGRYIAFASDGICSKKCCRYRVFESCIGAHLRCWRRAIDVYWFYKDKSVWSPAETAKYNKERANMLDLRERERHEGTLLAREEWWKSVELNDEHPYVLRKRIRPCYARQFGNAVLLPIYNPAGEIVSTQKIYPDGSKRFARSAPYAGGMLFLAEYPTPEIMITEGWATACSIREVTTSAICVAFNDSNMVAVAVAIKKMFPASTIIICGDRGESGVRFAKRAAEAVKGRAIIPAFDDGDDDYTDFNDVACFYGIDELERQMSFLKKG